MFLVAFYSDLNFKQSPIMQQSGLPARLQLAVCVLDVLVNSTLKPARLPLSCQKMTLQVQHFQENVNLCVVELLRGHQWENGVRVQRQETHSPGQASPSPF